MYVIQAQEKSKNQEIELSFYWLEHFDQENRYMSQDHRAYNYKMRTKNLLIFKSCQPREDEKLFAIYVSNGGLMFRIYNNSYSSILKGQIIQ